MKKLLVALVMIVGISCVASARDNYTRDTKVLPPAAQSMLSRQFKAAVSTIKVDKDLGRVSEYEVILADGSEVTFDRDGNWKDVEVSDSGSVPSAFLLKPMADYVKKNHAGARIVGVEKERNGFEVSLSNGIDLKFDKKGSFLRYDN